MYYVYMCICVYVYMYMYMNMYFYLYIYVYVNVYVYVYLYIEICTYIYIYIYTCIDIYIHIHTRLLYMCFYASKQYTHEMKCIYLHIPVWGSEVVSSRTLATPTHFSTHICQILRFPGQ